MLHHDTFKICLLKLYLLQKKIDYCVVFSRLVLVPRWFLPDQGRLPLSTFSLYYQQLVMVNLLLELSLDSMRVVLISALTYPSSHCKSLWIKASVSLMVKQVFMRVILYHCELNNMSHLFLLSEQ